MVRLKGEEGQAKRRTLQDQRVMEIPAAEDFSRGSFAEGRVTVPPRHNISQLETPGATGGNSWDSGVHP